MLKVLASAALVALAGCSPYGFSGEVGQFAEGVNQISAAFTAGYANVTNDTVARQDVAFRDRRAAVEVAPSCVFSSADGEAGSAPCRLYPAGGQPPQLTTLEKAAPETEKALAGLRNYAEALQALTNAADRAAFDAAAGRLQAAVGGLASLASSGAPGIGAIAPPAVAALAWLVGTGLDQERYNALRWGVNHSASSVRTIATVLGIGLDAINASRQEQLLSGIRELARLLGPQLSQTDYNARLALTEQRLSQLDALRHVNASRVATLLSRAHDKLLEAVNDPSRSIGDVARAIGEFADHAKALRDALAARSGS